MQIGMIGLGRMGANMAERLVGHGHHVVGFDPGERARDAASSRGRVSTYTSSLFLASHVLRLGAVWSIGVNRP